MVPARNCASLQRVADVEPLPSARSLEGSITHGVARIGGRPRRSAGILRRNHGAYHAAEHARGRISPRETTLDARSASVYHHGAKPGARRRHGCSGAHGPNKCRRAPSA